MPESGKVNIIFGKAMRACRLRAGVNQIQLARIMDTSRTTITNMENGSYNVTLHTASRLAKLLSIDLTVVTCEVDQKPYKEVLIEHHEKEIEKIKQWK